MEQMTIYFEFHSKALFLFHEIINRKRGNRKTAFGKQGDQF